MLSRRSRLAALLCAFVTLGPGCTGGPISDFPASNNGNGEDDGDHGGVKGDAGSPGAPGDGDEGDGDDSSGEGDGDGDGDSPIPGMACDAGVVGDGGAAGDASTIRCVPLSDGGVPDAAVADGG